MASLAGPLQTEGGEGRTPQALCPRKIYPGTSFQTPESLCTNITLVLWPPSTPGKTELTAMLFLPVPSVAAIRGKQHTVYSTVERDSISSGKVAKRARARRETSPRHVTLYRVNITELMKIWAEYILVYRWPQPMTHIGMINRSVSWIRPPKVPLPNRLINKYVDDIVVVQC